MRIRARRGHQIAAVAVALKLTVLCWHLVAKCEDYLWTRPALVANKTCAMQLQAGHPQQKGCQRGPAYAYNIKALRDREMLIAAHAERNYEQFVSQWKPRRPKTSARAPQLGRNASRFATRSPVAADGKCQPGMQSRSTPACRGARADQGQAFAVAANAASLRIGRASTDGRHLTVRETDEQYDLRPSGHALGSHMQSVLARPPPR
ncbi:hypothetical protein [Bradyrhizobium australiense]|uniref:hypothetical protein n=1 Tax=Bradyrhizobium australiense TaxID=2721161 RepID=UPI001AED507D|nr:hypothetical protein [Bradyrhizobium australiense]